MHPIFQAALAPYMPSTQKRMSVTASRKPVDGTETFYITLGNAPVECEIYWEAGERQTWDNPGYPAQATLQSAKVGGVDIIEILSDAQREKIEAAFLDQA